ncbi:MAG: NUDIX hydrolase [Candidatus Aenigmarchaeota archaeon]|nr:NUDIX hydrolase [Candidatus Aenigmarchaeota archaeon]
MWLDEKTYLKVRKLVPVAAADGVIIENGKVLLLKRRIEPKGYWCLPGGAVEYGERVEDAVNREVLEETGLRTKIDRLIGVYSDPKRDPRWHSIGIAYMMKVTGGKLCINEESEEARFFGKLPQKMAFDHAKIARDAFKMAKENQK